MTTIPPAPLPTRFVSFHRRNPVVYRMFKRFAQEIWDSGLRHTSHWLILNRIRYELMVTTRGDEYKIPNGYFAFYVRLYIVEHSAERGDAFTVRRMKPENDRRPEWFQTILAGRIPDDVIL